MPYLIHWTVSHLQRCCTTSLPAKITSTRPMRRNQGSSAAASLMEPVSLRLRNASLYASSVKMKSSVLTFRITAFTQALSSSFLKQFAHHLSMLLRIVSVLIWLFSLCSASTKSRNPAFSRSRPNSDRHFKIREIRRLLCGAPVQVHGWWRLQI